MSSLSSAAPRLSSLWVFELLKNTLGIRPVNGKTRVQSKNLEDDDESITGLRDDDSIPIEMNRNKLYDHFRTLQLINMKIDAIDKDMRRFRHLSVLSISVNYLEIIDNLPDSVQVLNAFGNRIIDVRSCKFPPNLIHLGLGYNDLTDIDGLKEDNLLSLDLSYNRMSDLSSCLETLKKMPNIKQLMLTGNPFCILREYRTLVIDALPQLTVLDEVTITKEERNSSRPKYQAPVIHVQIAHLTDADSLPSVIKEAFLSYPVSKFYHLDLLYTDAYQDLRMKSELFAHWKPSPHNIDLFCEIPIHQFDSKLIDSLRDVRIVLWETKLKEPLKQPEVKKKERNVTTPNTKEKLAMQDKKKAAEKPTLSASQRLREEHFPIRRSISQNKISDDLKAAAASEEATEAPEIVAVASVDLSAFLSGTTIFENTVQFQFREDVEGILDETPTSLGAHVKAGGAPYSRCFNGAMVTQLNRCIIEHMADITLYSHVFGPNPWKVVSLLKELNLSYESIFVDIYNKTPDFLTKTLNGRVPVIVDHKRNDKTLWESVAILLYLQHHYDKENRLWFTNEDEIADANQWLLFQASGIGPYFGQKGWFSNYHSEKIPSAIERYEKEIHRVLAVIEKHLEGKQYFVGNKYSIVDINNYVWLASVPWLLDDFQTAFQKYPNTGAYVKRLEEHKGIKEANAEKAALAKQDK
ncbi:hypothetical protein PROFUN_04597 [Planoprotostelium fungivorum]|uniref:Glutathione S-transferase n=1 Tax=Planoprotostelium fungivorum TaxID=1890364 RepID=A0A2P6NUH7_9EUKA|nr:hypothetical protein PROFUN_04597 [Planoprotostelium fungivorum]